MSEWDVVIVGGGIAGASLGAEIAPHRKTLIIEAESECGYHSTGRSAAFWLESYGGPKVALLSAASRAFLDRPPADFADYGFLRTRGDVHISRERWAVLPDGIEARQLSREELERLVPGIKAEWQYAVFEPACADIDVGGLHAVYLRSFRQSGGTVRTEAQLTDATFSAGLWTIRLTDGSQLTAATVVNAAGAWADPVARNCGVRPFGVTPKRRTMVQLRVGHRGLHDLPLVNDVEGTFYFKGEGDSSVWLSPHDEIETNPCDAAPDEIDIATAIHRFEQVVDWPVERLERRWAGLRSFAPDRLPIYGFDPDAPRFFWCVGQGGFGIQTAPAAAKLAAAQLLDHAPDPMIAHIDPAIFSPGRFA